MTVASGSTISSACVPCSAANSSTARVTMLVPASVEEAAVVVECHHARRNHPRAASGVGQDLIIDVTAVDERKVEHVLPEQGHNVLRPPDHGETTRFRSPQWARLSK